MANSIYCTYFTFVYFLVTPQDPIIEVNGLQLKDNDNVFISILSEPPQISCWSLNGYPATTLQWILNNTIMDYHSSDFTTLTHSSKSGGLVITELRFDTAYSLTWQQQNLTCKAQHSTYGDDEVRITSVNLILGAHNRWQ